MFLNIILSFRRLIIFLCVFGTYLYIRLHREPTSDELVNRNKVDNLTCHYVHYDDALPLIDARVFRPPKKSIFFHDTSCKGRLNSRQLCAIESAARRHTNREIYVFFSGPISKFNLASNLAVIDHINNVHLARIHMSNYAADSAVKTLMVNGILNKTNWGIENMSNVLRFLTLHKWSGVYLDTDVVVVKSFDSLPDNWIAREDKEIVNAAAISLSDDDIGRHFAGLFVEEIVTSYRPDIWSHNGPGAVTRVLMRECETDDVTLMSAENCQGFTVLPPKLIYPIHYKLRKRYFKPDYTQNTSEAYVHHLWNRLTYHLVIPNNSLYYNLAKEFCPSVQHLYGNKFGI